MLKSLKHHLGATMQVFIELWTMKQECSNTSSR